MDSMLLMPTARHYLAQILLRACTTTPGAVLSAHVTPQKALPHALPSTASAARLPDLMAPSSVALSRWSPHTNRPDPSDTGRLKSVGGACRSRGGSGGAGGMGRGGGEQSARCSSTSKHYGL